jgi:intergrase/recombinase
MVCFLKVYCYEELLYVKESKLCFYIFLFPPTKNLRAQNLKKSRRQKIKKNKNPH